MEAHLGGYGSSRWGTTVTRVSTEGLLQLDVRALAREGSLRSGTSATVTWSDGASITAEVPPEHPGTVTMECSVGSGNGLWLSIREDVALVMTSCTLGGTMVWFRCPGCSSRCAILYALEGLFQCRRCHRLTYASTREMKR